MKKKAHSESEMVKAVKTLENGVSADTVAREFGISKGTLYNWESKYSGMNVSQIQRLIWINGKPKNIRCDNGPEFISHEFQSWCKGNDICIKYTRPGCPTQNSYIERFNGTYRRAVLDAYKRAEPALDRNNGIP